MRSLLKSEMHPLMRAASLMHRYSGSDILEVCKLAARGCVLAEIAEPSAPTSPVSASSQTPPGSPLHRGLDAEEGVCGDERRGTNGAAALVDATAAGPVTEAVLLRCISEVRRPLVCACGVRRLPELERGPPERELCVSWWERHVWVPLADRDSFS